MRQKHTSDCKNLICKVLPARLLCRIVSSTKKYLLCSPVTPKYDLLNTLCKQNNNNKKTRNPKKSTKNREREILIKQTKNWKGWTTRIILKHWKKWNSACYICTDLSPHRPFKTNAAGWNVMLTAPKLFSLSFVLPGLKLP